MQLPSVVSNTVREKALSERPMSIDEVETERLQIEKNLSDLMRGCDFTTLYTHPKMMEHYYWKDEKLNTRK